MKFSDLKMHLYRLEDVRVEIINQGDEPPQELEDRLRRVRSAVAAVRQRQEQLAPASVERPHLNEA
ncbi:hypothetical protein [Gemmata sp.]|uniref:hypothetical protein n=1 Tax=Gemmata sp. TaxID=1914242 RepID=UPI003F6F56EB